MPNIEDNISSLKTTWVRRIVCNKYKFLNILNTEIDTDNIFKLGDMYIEQKIGKNSNLFWRDVLKAHLKLQNKLKPINMDAFLSSPLFFNKDIKCGTTFFNKAWFDKGICFINDIIKLDGTFASQNELKNNFNININFLQYYGLVKAIQDWGKSL